MNEWFGPEVARWFSLLSLMSLVAITSIWIQRGQHKKLVTGIYVVCLSIGGLFLGASVLARILEQPSYVVRPLLVTGIVVTVCFAATLPVMRKGYAEAEERKILAKDL
ncbi:MAG: hypothetical protein PVH89_00600 [Gammaproteobacteria bacterium]|jgi:hypothetical protein